VTFEIRLLPNAARDVTEVESYYDLEAPEQTARFIEQFITRLVWISEHATLPQVDELGLRHVSMKIYRYHVWYRVLGDSVIVQVVAVLHHSRDPDEVGWRAIGT
jgi:plasmid stabilization system protein ParE